MITVTCFIVTNLKVCPLYDLIDIILNYSILIYFLIFLNVDSYFRKVLIFLKFSQKYFRVMFCVVLN